MTYAGTPLDHVRWLGDESDPPNLTQPLAADSILESVDLADFGRTL